MNSDPTAQLIDEILARDDLMPETVADMRDYQARLASGELDGDDRRYIAALHGRLTSTPPSRSEAEPAAETIETWRERALRAERRVAFALEDAKFEEVKQRFARMYGPAANGGSRLDEATRAALFGEFWPEFEDVGTDV